ncbi:hypothetical protein BJ165DRAFT_1398568 [Panaeolus papilionaceus]|nr:hypothetical protein BJ165DRAFT_1398568 [Panaeolus papilionaceus]
MPLCNTYNPRNAHTSPVRTKTKGKGRRAMRGTSTIIDNDTVVAKTATEKTMTEKTVKTGAVLDAIKEIGAIAIGSAPTSASSEGTATSASNEENQNGTSKPRGSVLSGGNVLVPVTNTSSVGEEKATKKAAELEQKNSKDQDDMINEGEAGEGEWRDKEGLAFEHARQRAKKAGERAKRRARKAEMQAVAMAFVAPVVEEREVRKEREEREDIEEANLKNGDGGNGLHKGSRVGRVGMRKADAGNFKVDVKGMVDLDMSGVDSYFKKAQTHERVKSMSGELKGLDFGLEGIGREGSEGRREVSLSELVYFAAQKKPRKNKGHDFEMIPALKTVIVLDDAESADVEMDEAWDHIDDLSMDGEVELSYAKVVAGGGH